jgi:allantoin racemase
MSRTIRIAVVNPNATEVMTEQIVATVRRTLGSETEVIGYTNHSGPAAIQGPEDGAACLPGLMAAYDRAVAEQADAVIIGCFDDTGLSELRELGRIPVVGLGEASCIAASLAAPSFVVVTTLEVSVPVIAANIARSGLAKGCKAVIASGVPVLELESKAADVKAAIAQARETHSGSAVVLGCSGMTAIMPELRSDGHHTLIDPAQAAARLVQGALSL